MARYTLRHGYASNHNGRTFGPWAAGDVVEFDEADAEWVERDSPGALEPEKKAERQQPPAADRQHKGAANRGRR